MAPIEAAFPRLWPDALLMNLLDDSLPADLARDEGACVDSPARSGPNAKRCTLLAKIGDDGQRGDAACPWVF